MKLLTVLCILSITLTSTINAVSIRGEHFKLPKFFSELPVALSELPSTGKYFTETPTALRIALDTLNQMEELANGLIISEGVVEGSTNVSTIAIDFMIMGHMRNKPGWIERIGKQEVENNMTEQFEKLYEEFQPLKNILENGINTTIEVEEISKMIDIIRNISVAERVRSNIQQFKSFAENVTSYIDGILKEFNEESIKRTVENLLFIEELSIKPNSIELVNAVRDTIRMISYPDLDSIEIEKFLQRCEKSLEKCFASLKFILNDFPSLDTVLVGNDYFLRLFKLMDRSNLFLELTVEKTNSFQQIKNMFSSFSKSESGQITDDDDRQFSNLISSIKMINTEELRNMDSLLCSLLPAAQITKEMLNSYQNDGLNTKYSNGSFVTSRFKSYSGFENDIGMFKIMADSLDPNYEFPSQFSKVPLRSRSIFIQKLAATLHPFSEFSNGLLLVDDISKVKPSIMQILDKITSDFQDQISTWAETVNGLPDFIGNVDVLTELVERVSVSSGMIEDIVDLSTVLSDSDTRTEISAALREIPNLLEAGIYLSTAIGKYEQISSNERTADKFQEVVDGVKKVKESYRRMMKPLNASRILGDEMMSLRFYMKRTASISELKNKGVKYSIENFLELPGKWKNIRESMGDNKSKLQNSESYLSSFEYLSPFENITKDQELIEKTKKLLKLVSNSSIIDFKVNEEPSEKMSKLIAGTPFGSEILDKLHNGIHSYQSLVDGLILTGNLKQDIEKLKSEDSKLGKKVEKLLNGVEAMEVNIDAHHSNPLQCLETLPYLVESLKNSEKWIEGVRKSEQVKIKKDLRIMKKTASNTIVSLATRRLNGFVSQLQIETANGIRSLTDGIQTFLEKLSHVEASQVPTLATELVKTAATLEITGISETTTTLPSTVTPVTAHLVRIEVEATTGIIAEDSTLTTWSFCDTFFILMLILLLILPAPHAYYFFKEHKDGTTKNGKRDRLMEAGSKEQNFSEK